MELHIEDAEVAYRGFLIGKSTASTSMPLKFLTACALKVFREIANASRNSHPDDFAAFQAAISFKNGAGWGSR